MKFEKISKRAYSMAYTAETEAEIIMYGEIVETHPKNYYTGELLEGSFIIQDEFLTDFETLVSAGMKKLKLRMNTVGGDAGVSILIHNRIRDIVNSGVEVSCIVDGVAMSGGSLIMCACDNVVVNPSSLIMIHKAWSFLFGGYNADDLRNLAKRDDAWDAAQLNIYNRKCKLSDTVISHMMSETTYMTGKEAIEKGFADELTEGETKISASEDKKTFFCNGHSIRALGIIPDNIPIIKAQNADEAEKNTTPEEGEEGGAIMAKNLEELRAENPELAAVIEDEMHAAERAAQASAAEAERQRLSDIDEIACLYDADTVRNAKYGENACTAQEMAFRAAVANAKKGTSFMTDLKSDNEESKANEVGSAASPEKVETAESAESIKAAAKADVDMVRQMKGEKR